MSELAKRHTQKLFPTGKVFDLIITLVPFDKCLKLFMGNKTYQLRKNVFALVHNFDYQ